jgi:hypothetical protein
MKKETYIDKCKLKLGDFIENIEQLGANARYYNNYEDYDNLYIQLKSIEYWSKKASKVVKQIKNNEYYERGIK